MFSERGNYTLEFCLDPSFPIHVFTLDSYDVMKCFKSTSEHVRDGTPRGALACQCVPSRYRTDGKLGGSALDATQLRAIKLVA